MNIGQNSAPQNVVNTGEMTVTFIDVGQGDSAFIELPGGKTILIDAGVSDSADKIYSVISSKGYKKIDIVVATHPHADHIGAMKDIISWFEIGDIYMPRVSTNTKTYEKLLEEIASQGLKIKTAKAGVTICEGVDMIAPVSDEYEDLNDYSAVIRIVNGNNVFLFMGDAETESENEIMNAGYDVRADVIKVGHHGSSTSSGKKFVSSVGAKYAVFSLGEGNSYNHPHKSVVDRWEASGARILRTDKQGDIIFISDGTDINVKCEKQEGE